MCPGNSVLFGAALALLLLPSAVFGQKPWEYGGFVEEESRFYPRRPNPSDARFHAAGRFQLWTRASFNRRLSWRATADFQLDTHRDVDRRRWLDLAQRDLRQPAGAVTEFYLDLKLAKLDFRLGKQEIRWGRADGFNPTDNLIPYDYLDTFADVRIAVPALKADAYLGKARIEAAWLPFYTPTRLPLMNQRWFPKLPGSAKVTAGEGEQPLEVDLFYRDGAHMLPARTLGNSQWGIRWNQLVPRAEFSLSYFDGIDDIPFFRARAIVLPLEQLVFNPQSAIRSPQFLVLLDREYHRIKVAGADFASSLGPFGVRGELAYFDRTDPTNRDHLLFIVGMDRSWGDWFGIFQYAGQRVAGNLADSAVFPDLGLRSTLIFRLERAMGPTRNFEIKGALRLRDGDIMLRPLYTVALSNNWRLRVEGTLFGGSLGDFLGQYRDNGHLNIQLRYAF